MDSMGYETFLRNGRFIDIANLFVLLSKTVKRAELIARLKSKSRW